MPLIKNKEAVIHTTAIEIKTLTIEGKQVTLSVFRQLPLSQYVHRLNGEIFGTPWGWVNYFWNGAEKFNHYKGEQSLERLHIVWQSGNTLYRDLVPVHYIYAHVAREQTKWIVWETQAIDTLEAYTLEDPNKYTTVGYQIGPDTRSVPVSEWARESKAYVHSWTNVHNEISKLKKSLAESHSNIANYYSEQTHREWPLMIQYLRSLPQLFIAI